MCAQYLIKHDSLETQSRWPLSTSVNLLFKGASEVRVVPHSPAPVLVVKSGSPEWRMMRFSLVPSWSKEQKVKFATYNARIETVLEKPTWKKPFLNKHCLVPLNDFVEAIYTGEHAGNMMRFHSEACVWVAGIYDEWINKETGEVTESFALLTTKPDVFVESVGHDRMPVFLNEAGQEQWLNSAGQAGETLVSLIDKAQVTNSWSLKVDRPLKSGWEKRV